MSKRTFRLDPSHPFNTRAKDRQREHLLQVYPEVLQVVANGDLCGLMALQADGFNLSSNQPYGEKGRGISTPLILAIEGRKYEIFDWLCQQRLWFNHISQVALPHGMGCRQGTALDAAYLSGVTDFTETLLRAGARKVVGREFKGTLASDLIKMGLT